MKKLIAIALLAAPAFGQDLGVKELWFFGKQGTVSGNVAFTYAHSEVKVGGAGKSLNSNTYSPSLLVSYSFLDNLNFGVQLTYAHETSEGIKDKSGIEQPTLSGAYRVFDSSTLPLFLDVILNLTPTLGEADSTNMYTGGNEIVLKVSLGQVMGDFAYKISPALEYQTVQHVKGSSDIEASMNWILTGDVQYNLSQPLAATAGFILGLPGDTKTIGATTSYDYAAGISLGGKYQPCENMVASLTGLYGIADGTLKGTGYQANFNSDIYTLTAKLDYAF